MGTQQASVAATAYNRSLSHGDWRMRGPPDPNVVAHMRGTAPDIASFLESQEIDAGGWLVTWT